MKTVDKRPETAEGGLERCGPSRRRKDLSMWTGGLSVGLPTLPQSHTNLDLWAIAGYDKKYDRVVHEVAVGPHTNHPTRRSSRVSPGIFQYYSIAEDELQKTFAGKQTAQQGRR